MRTPWPFRHPGLKALSIAFAVMLWFGVSGDETVERGLRVPLEFQQFPSGLEMMGEAPSLVDVRVRGASSTLSQLGPGDIVAQIDLRNAGVGRRLYQLTPEQVRVPFGVQVVQVTPPSVGVSFERSAAKQVPVVPAVDGEPAPGYVVGTVAVEPPSVEVVGPRSAVEQVTEAVTEPVSVEGASREVTEAVTVGFLDSALRLKTPRQAQVRIQIVPGPVERTVRERPVHLTNIDSRLVASAEPNVVDVVLRGSRADVSVLSVDEVVAFIDLAGLGAGTYSLPVKVESPSHAGVARVLPATIQVIITRGKD
jgi:YbbR domain-containing protein